MKSFHSSLAPNYGINYQRILNLRTISLSSKKKSTNCIVNTRNDFLQTYVLLVYRVPLFVMYFALYYHVLMSHNISLFVLRLEDQVNS